MADEFCSSELEGMLCGAPAVFSVHHAGHPDEVVYVCSSCAELLNDMLADSRVVTEGRVAEPFEFSLVRLEAGA